LQSNRKFLLSLCPQSFLDERAQALNEKKETMKKQWIADHKADPRLDYDIIFKSDDDIHDGRKMQFSFHGKDGAAGG